MNGLELSERFFYSCGEPELKNVFKDDYKNMAIGLAGHGSECFGFDDELSSDHDYDCGFCIWLTEEDYRKFGFKLERTYDDICKRAGVFAKEKSIGGSNFKGVRTVENFYSFYLGSPALPKTNDEWLAIPDFYLAEATNGNVFYDGKGEFTRIRNAIKNDRPADVRLKKLASELFYCAQFGQYNYYRCLKRNDGAAAAYCISSFCYHAACAAFLIANEYAPYYKWIFRALDNLPQFSFLRKQLNELCLTSPLNPVCGELSEKICAALTEEINKQSELNKNGKLHVSGGCDLERYAYAVTNLIKDGNLRNSPVML